MKNKKTKDIVLERNVEDIQIDQPVTIQICGQQRKAVIKNIFDNGSNRVVLLDFGDKSERIWINTRELTIIK